MDGSALSPSTRRAYSSRVRGYLRWLSGPEVGGSDLGGGDPLADPQAMGRAIGEYRSYLESEREARPTTVNATLTALDHFHAHLGPGQPTPRVEQREPPPSPLSWNELDAFHGAVGLLQVPRDRAIALVLVDTGLLASELVALDLGDLHLARQPPRLTVRTADEAKRRQIPISPAPRATLTDWLRERNDWPATVSEQAVFINRRGTRLSTRWITELVVTIGQIAGLARAITPALLRRTFASTRLDSGDDPSRVAKLMGHKRLQTTNAYLPRTPTSS